MRRVFTTALTVFAVGVTAGPATAADAGPGVTAEGNSVGVVMNGGLQMVVACTAVGTGAIVSVAIKDCYTTNGVSAPDRALPGPFAATAGAGMGRLEPYSLCVRAIATDINGRTYDTGVRCSGDIGYAAAVVATS